MDEDKLKPWTRYTNAYEAAEKASEEAREIVKCLGIPYSDAMYQIREAKFEFRKALLREWQTAYDDVKKLQEAGRVQAEKDYAEYKERKRREREESEQLEELEEFRLWKAQQPPKKI